MPTFKNPEAAEKWARITYGCGHEEALAINGAPLKARGSFAYAYFTQKHEATKRGIAWEFTLPEWVAVWLESGKWALRGVGVGRYCMARHGDAGPYAAHNVSIQLSTENSRDGIKKAQPAIRAALANKARTRAAGSISSHITSN